MPRKAAIFANVGEVNGAAVHTYTYRESGKPHTCNLKCDSNDFVDFTEETYFREQVPLIKKNITFKTYFHFFMRKKTVEPTIWKTLYGPLTKTWSL